MFPGNGAQGGARGFGFGDFPGFPMLPGFGRMAGGRGRSLIEDFFGHDPFEDPFFRSGPSMMFGNNSMFGRGGLFGDEFFPRMAMPMPRPSEFFIDQRPGRPPPPQQEVRKGPVIEELSDDDETPPLESKSNNKEEPIVEHPDDDGHHGDSEHEPRYTPQRSETRYTPQHHHPPQYQQSTTSRSFCYSSSTISGPDGVYYTSASKRRINPNGVIEEEFHEKDGSSGTENKRFAVSIGDKMHAVAKKRNSDGRETTLETLHNLSEDEAVKFDRAWGKHLAGTSSSTSDRYELLEDKPNDQSRGSHSQPLFLKGARDEYDIKKH